eukprot:scaffold5111_cov145-Skeletonema_menzelii.AAC.2
MAEENQCAGGGNPVQWKGEGMSFVGEMGVGGEIMVQSDFKFNSISSPNQISLRLCFTVCILKCKGQ